MKEYTRHYLFLAVAMTIFVANTCAASELIPVRAQEQWGYANNELEIVIPPQWDYASYFRASKTAMVGKRQADGSLLYGLIDQAGKYLVPCEYHISAGESEAFFGGENGYYHICDGTLQGYYDIQNDVFCEPKYAGVDIWYKNNENIISVAKTEDSGLVYINAVTGEQIGEFEYFMTYPWHKNAALCMTFDSDWIQFIDGSRTAIPAEYSIYSDISHGLFIVGDEDRYALMNLQGKIVSAWYADIEVTPMGDFYAEDERYFGIVYCQE